MMNGGWPTIRPGSNTKNPAPTGAIEFRVSDTPLHARSRIKLVPNESEKRFVNREQNDLLNVARLPPVRSDVAGEDATGETGFIDEKQLLARLPISRGTLGNWKAKGLVPYIKIGRRCLYDWPSVQSALLRRQRGGQS
jgi:hypothetical protein